MWSEVELSSVTVPSICNHIQVVMHVVTWFSASICFQTYPDHVGIDSCVLLVVVSFPVQWYFRNVDMSSEDCTQHPPSRRYWKGPVRGKFQSAMKQRHDRELRNGDKWLIWEPSKIMKYQALKIRRRTQITPLTDIKIPTHCSSFFVLLGIKLALSYCFLKIQKEAYPYLTLSVPSSKSTFSQPFKEKCIS